MVWVTSSMVEHFPYKEEVSGSNPLLPIKILRGSSSVVRVLACHAKCRGFNPRLSRDYFRFLHLFLFYNEMFVC